MTRRVPPWLLGTASFTLTAITIWAHNHPGA